MHSASRKLSVRNPIILSAAVIISLHLFAERAEAASCGNAMKQLGRAQQSTNGSEAQLRQIRQDFSAAQRSRSKWKRKIRKHGCNSNKADPRKCARAFDNHRAAKREMRALQQDEHKVLRRLSRQRSKEAKLERVRQVSCGRTLPAPRRARRTREEVIASQAAGLIIGIGLGVLSGQLSNGRGGVANCRANPLGANC